MFLCRFVESGENIIQDQDIWAGVQSACERDPSFLSPRKTCERCEYLRQYQSILKLPWAF